MVLHKRRPITSHGAEEPPDDVPVWTIEETDELFTNYDDFVQRWTFYGRREFACELTGKSGLTFFAAYRSEVDAAKRPEKAFPNILKAPTLRKVQHSPIARFDSLVDATYDDFRQTFVPGEWVHWNTDEFGRWDVLVAERIDIVSPPSTRYLLDLPNGFPSKEDTRVVEAAELTRDRTIFTKANLRTYLKTALRKDGSIWVVRDLFRLRYRIADPRAPPPKIIPPKGNAAKPKPEFVAPVLAVKEEVVPSEPVDRSIVEDLDLPEGIKRPVPQREEGVSEHQVELLLESWAFLNVFLEVLMLDSFTLDDFADALRSTQESELIDEIYCTLLKALVVEREGNSLPSLRPLEQLEPVEGEDAEGIMEEQPWRDVLVRKRLGQHAWIECIDGVLRNLPRGHSQQSTAETVLEALHPSSSDSDEDYDERSLSERFFGLSADRKLEVLAILIDLLWQLPIIRNYLDECMEYLTQLRKDRADASKVKRAYMDTIYKLRVKMRTQYPRFPVADAGAAAAGPGAAAQTNGKGGDESDDESLLRGDDDDDEDRLPVMPSPAKKRASGRLSKAARREDEDASTNAGDEYRLPNGDTSHEALMAALTDWEASTASKFYTGRADYHADIEHLQALLLRAEDKVREIDEDFRESDAQRLRRLGEDRYHNTYYWLEASGMPTHGMPTSSTAHAGFASGRLFVRGPLAGFTESLKSLQNRNHYDRRVREEGKGFLADDRQWAYYETTEQVEQLLRYLQPRGERESRLRAQIDARLTLMQGCMDARRDYISPPKVEEPEPAAQAPEAAVPEEFVEEKRRSSRKITLIVQPPPPPEELPRFKLWRNDMAMEILGHTHSGNRSAHRGRATTKKRKR